MGTSSLCSGIGVHLSFLDGHLAFVAQWLEHWSCKPGVESSNLSEGCLNVAYELIECITDVSCASFSHAVSSMGTFPGRDPRHSAG